MLLPSHYAVSIFRVTVSHLICAEKMEVEPMKHLRLRCLKSFHNSGIRNIANAEALSVMGASHIKN